MMERQFDTLVFSRAFYDRIKPRTSFQAETKEQAIEWQNCLRRKLIQLLGGFPKKRCPLKPEVLEIKKLSVKDHEQCIVRYTRQTVVFNSREELSVFGYFLLPEGFKAPGCCIICLPGHGFGVDDIVGINEDGSLREFYGGYQNDFALQCVANGFAALSIEQIGFGHMRDERARAMKADATSCEPSAGAALLFGQTMLGWRVYNVIRTIDYLESRSEVDKHRIAVMGISGGGTVSLFSSAVDTRIKATVVSGYFNTFKDSIMSLPHCIDNYVPSILKWAEMYDIAGLIAPKALFVESGTKDTIFPVHATKAAFDKVKRIYSIFNTEDKLGIQIFEGEHIFYGKEAFKFLSKNL